MDWKQCIKKRYTKETSKDFNKAESYKEIIESKLESARILPQHHFYAKITLMYDALRTILEIKALQEGYKIYNHECYTAFLKEILNLSGAGDQFDELRMIRNGINYYGKEITLEESKEIIQKLERLIKKFKNTD